MSEIAQLDCKIQNLLSDKDTKLILESIKATPKSTSQLCIECKIPTSTAYRKIQRLYGYRMIRKIGIINEAGKRETLYKSNTASLKMSHREELC